MAVRPDRRSSQLTLLGDPLPALLTVEEAAELLRIGRTKAYAMTREWRETGGRSGLPVVDFGDVLRVPLAALEDMVGASLTSSGGRDAAAVPPLGQVADASRSETPRRRGRRAGGASAQLGLFGPTA